MDSGTGRALTGAASENSVLVERACISPAQHKILPAPFTTRGIDMSFPAPDEPSTAAAGGPHAPQIDTERLADVGTAFLVVHTPGPMTTVVELEDGAGVCVVQSGRGGAKVYVAPDETVLFVPSAMDFDTGLTAFLNGRRTHARPTDEHGRK
ncbi:hypothetical protein AB0I00_25895 [Streptomyces sp. NPDC050803]|uniref:hypothetical protein n=1 Tax=unclassified Streptomyces TaxID=2593676 RepID=UPI00342ABF42